MKVNQLKAGAALSYASMVIGYIVSIIYTPMMLRLLGQSEYGLYNLVASIVAYLGVLNFGFGSTYMRYYTRYKVLNDREKIAALNGMFLIIFSIIGLIAVIAGAILAFNTELIFGVELTDNELSRAKILMIILVLNLAISFPSIVFNSHIIANEEFVFQKFIQMIKTVINPFIILPILLMGYGSVGMVVVTTIFNLIIEITNMTFCIKKLNMKFSFRSLEIKLMKEMTIFSSYIFLYMVVDQINWNVDKFILGRHKGTSEVAIYSIGAQLNTYLISISTVISSVFIPRVNSIVAKNSKDRELTTLFIKIGRIQYIFVLLVIIGFIVFGRSFINLWAGENYLVSYYVATVLMIPMLTSLIQNIGIEIRKAQNKHKTAAFFMTLVACINILISIPLAKYYGAIGSAIGTSIAVIINQIFINVYYHKVIGLDILLFWKEIIQLSKGAFIPICTAIVMMMNKNHFADLTFLLLAIPFSVLYLLSMYKFGLNNFEKKLFFNDNLKKLSITNLRKS
ncbi:lipopolysaccharide biosynthesis protein [Trichococcus pasteurii]|uniref:Polysaccharide biosynthesis protein n=1 Tax=Trichococcus pasteurii TaxID=43064 RepID=A0A1W1IIQ8_9LACT|nr:oligosaccharide flippase family protein [Trichococcus pasteurii]SFF09029.1 Membrane protein involved in the export of O-antigen and teichoic acid [Trichococcus pasteurii]SLM52739.1 polysaccharide biosynthesis protein [Trichococcus pasteurii]SSB93620.1 polysaccharide biosynthesis protein [Trichococcus pasteurii]